MKFGLSKNSEGEYYFPLYTDDEAWQETHNKNKRDEGEKFLKEQPNWENFRDSCYKKAETSEYCPLTHGWCLECARNTGWTLERTRGVIKE